MTAEMRDGGDVSRPGEAKHSRLQARWQDDGTMRGRDIRKLETVVDGGDAEEMQDNKGRQMEA